ncbi:hypothetical protein [Streptomyces misionensis]
MATDPARTRLQDWAESSHGYFIAFAEQLEVDRETLEENPSSFLPYLDDFVASLPFDDLEEDDWVWLTTGTAAFLGEVILHTGRARWDLTKSRFGRDVPVLRVRGQDDQEHFVEPFEYASRELRQRPPVFTRALARMRAHAGLATGADEGGI